MDAHGVLLGTIRLMVQQINAVHLSVISRRQGPLLFVTTGITTIRKMEEKIKSLIFGVLKSGQYLL